MASNHRSTRQRRAVREVLGRLPGHPTASEIYAAVRRRLPHISLGTVYRDLEVLVDEGEAVKLPAPGKEARFDDNCRPHAHIRCVVCGRLQDLKRSALGWPARRIRRLAGFQVIEARVDLRGICPECQGIQKKAVKGRPARIPGKGSRTA